MRRIELALSLGLLVLLMAGAGRAFATPTVTDLHDFDGTDGDQPLASVIQGADGNIYGTTLNGTGVAGTVFSYDLADNTFSTVYPFPEGDDGGEPGGSLIELSDGYLYGTASAFGANNDGVVFKVKPDGTGYTVLHAFAGGTTDGGNPGGGLILGADGYLYGTTEIGGTDDGGTIYKISTDGSTYQVVYSFLSDSDVLPIGNLVQDPDGVLYGITLFDGSDNEGMVYKIDTDGSNFTVLHSFTGSSTDGLNPGAGVIIGGDGYLYGTTRGGGANGDGMAYKISTGGSNFTDLHDFDDTDGVFLNCALVIGNDNNLYGTTKYSGADGFGTIFDLSQDGSTFNTLYAFTGSDDGSNPVCGLAAGTDGNFYGVCSSAGANGDGNVFQFTNSLPASPTGLALVAGTKQLTLNWNVDSTATSYNIYRATSPGQEGGTPLATGLTSSTYTDTNLNPLDTYYYEVTAVVSGNETAKSAEASAAPQASALTTFQAGLQMISAPSDYTGLSFSQYLSNSSLVLAVWDPADSEYVTSPTSPANTIVPGQGYWVRVPDSSTLSLWDVGSDTTTTAAIDVPLAQGWNMIGDPMSVVAPASGLQVKVGATTYTYANANLAGIVGENFYTYQPGDSAYEVLPASSGTLQPFEGYWVYAFEPCTVIFPAGG